MFKNRSFLVKLIKDGKDDGVVDTESTDQTNLVETIAESTMAIIMVYMVTDTLRKILVHVVATKIN